MQTLWARVAQVRGSCHCPQCLSQASAVSRRATATATRRAPKYLTSSTLWYSGVFAVAATFDAGVKKRRREQWDQAIAGVKEELEQPASNTIHHLVEQDVTELQGMMAKTSVLNEHEEIEVGYGVAETNDLTEFDTSSDIFRDIDPRRPRPVWPTNTGPALRVDHLAPESIFADDGRRSLRDKSILSPKKVLVIQLAVEILQLNIFLEMQRRGWSDEAAKAVPEQFARHFLLSKNELQSHLDAKTATLWSLCHTDCYLTNYKPEEHKLQLCRFTDERSGRVRDSLYELSETIQGLFDIQTNENMSKPALLGKICYNLSASSAPPNLTVFNTLLLGFTRAQEPVILDNVIDCIRGSYMRPNEVTLAAVLRHYIKTDQSGKFTRWMGLIRGKRGGLALARPGVPITPENAHRLIQKPSNPNKTIQLPYATPYVFSAVIEGVIKFAGFDTALSICRTMGMDGWGLCMSGLTPLLQDCAERADWTSGMVIWSQIQALRQSSRRRLTNERIGLETFAAMLRLCSRCGKRNEFDVTWGHAIKAHRDSSDTLVRLIKGERIPSTPVRIEDMGTAQQSDDGQPNRFMWPDDEHYDSDLWERAMS